MTAVDRAIGRRGNGSEADFASTARITCVSNRVTVESKTPDAARCQLCTRTPVIDLIHRSMSSSSVPLPTASGRRHLPAPELNASDEVH